MNIDFWRGGRGWHISTEHTAFMLKLRDAREFKDEQNKQRMKIDEAETTVKVELDILEEEVHVGAEGLTTRNVDEGAQMWNITEAGKLVRIEQDVVQAQQTHLFTSIRSHVTYR